MSTSRISDVYRGFSRWLWRDHHERAIRSFTYVHTRTIQGLPEYRDQDIQAMKKFQDLWEKCSRNSTRDHTCTHENLYRTAALVGTGYEDTHNFRHALWSHSIDGNPINPDDFIFQDEIHERPSSPATSKE